MSKRIGLLLLSLAGLVVAQGAVAVTVTAPEIDPASAVSGLMLLSGGLLILRGRRRKK
jgi:LPXTG-motif cell wall-anchored protein